MFLLVTEDPSAPGQWVMEVTWDGVASQRVTMPNGGQTTVEAMTAMVRAWLRDRDGLAQVEGCRD